MAIVHAKHPSRTLLLALLACTACGDSGPLAELFRDESPYEQYLARLRDAGFTETALGRDWSAAGERALVRPVIARLPFRETGYFPPDVPSAVVYRLELRRGRKLSIEVSFQTERPARLFVDLFRLAEGSPPKRVASLPLDTLSLTYDVRRDGTYLLRLQPELLRGGRYTIVEQTRASLRFPIPGSSTRAVRSGFGAERDAGARQHQGIDIFARRGTPAVAVAAGRAQASTNELGGNVVWLQDANDGRTYYYAHLERWAVEGSEAVLAGDTLGYIGNTGNARTTRPHLHFGIYEGGPVDPLPFLLPDDPAAPAIAAPADRFGQWVRVTAAQTALRSGPHRGADTLRQLERDWVARVSAASQRALRVRLSDDVSGYVDADAVSRADRPLRRAQLDSGAVLRESPKPAAPALAILSVRGWADVLGRFGDFELVRLPDGRQGWLQTGTSDQ